MSFFQDHLSQRHSGQPASKEALAGIDRWDREDVEAISDEMADFRRCHDSLCDVAETGDPLSTDVLLSLVKVDPEAKPLGEMKPSHVINNKVLQAVQKSVDYQRVRLWTEGDIIAAANAFVAMEPDIEVLYSKIDSEDRRKAADLERRLEELEGRLDGLQDLETMIEQWKDAQDESTLDDPDVIARLAQLQEALDSAQVEIVDAEGGLEADFDAWEEGLDGMVRVCMLGIKDALGQVADDYKELSEAMTLFGSEPGELRRMDAAARLALAERLHAIPDFKKFADLVGMMQRMTEEMNEKRTVYYAQEEIYDVTVGAHLERLLPSELLALAEPLMEPIFYQNYIDEHLLEYAFKGQEKVGKGGIIYCMDCSGSMQGQREQWAKATGLATLNIAKMQKRPFYGIHFASEREIKTFDFRKPEDVTMNRVLDYAEHFFGGGTDFTVPLTKALRLLQDEEKAKGSVEGDIVFVTDGQAYLSPEFLAMFHAEQERLQFRVWGIMIGGHTTMEPLHSLCKGRVVSIQDLLSGNAVATMFRQL